MFSRCRQGGFSWFFMSKSTREGTSESELVLGPILNGFGVYFGRFFGTGTGTGTGASAGAGTGTGTGAVRGAGTQRAGAELNTFKLNCLCKAERKD